MQDKEILEMLKDVHGDGVMCTNGLFSIYDNKHHEIYIDPITGEIDKRTSYRTLVVLDETIVAQVLDHKDARFVILKKDDLHTLYSTKGKIYYIDNDLVCDYINNSCKLISHTGKILNVYNDTQSIKKIWNSYYITQSFKMYSDIALHYNRCNDSISNISMNERYDIDIINKTKGTVLVTPMGGISYKYDFKNKKVYNTFTGKEVDKQLFVS